MRGILTHRPALAPVAPAFYSSPDDLVKIKNTPVIVVQGDDDPFVSVNQTRQFVEKMKSLGMKYVYIEVPGGVKSQGQADRTWICIWTTFVVRRWWF